MAFYGNQDIKGNKKLNIFLDQAIAKAGFTSRKVTISQKVPTNWRQLAECGASRVRTVFKEANVDVVLAADEIFVRFHEGGSKVVAPKGVKRVGLSVLLDDKDGCTVLPTMDMFSSLLLASMLIFRDTFGGTLMKKWSAFSKRFLLFTRNY